MATVRDWMWTNQLKVNPDKTEMMVVDRSHDLG